MMFEQFEEAGRLQRILSTWEHAQRVFDHDELAAGWMTRPHRLLQHETPIKVVEGSWDGKRRVDEILELGAYQVGVQMQKKQMQDEGTTCMACGSYIGSSALGQPRLCDSCKRMTRGYDDRDAITYALSDKLPIECPECGIEDVHTWEDGWRCPNCGELHSTSTGDD